MMSLQASAGANEPTPMPERPPNIVVLLTDDQGYGDVGFNGNELIVTPNLDRLAREGTQFSQFYVAPVCAPTRASLLTGRYHQRTGVQGVVEGREFMTSAEVTIAESLSGAGYATGMFGKWHLGENYPFVPHAQGFDEFVGFRTGGNPYFDSTIEHNGEPYFAEGYLTDVLTDHAVRFIEQHQHEPFFVYLPYNAPHTNLEVPEKYLRPYKDLPPTQQYVYAMMTSVDENVGRMIAKLDELGLSENTLIVYLSDNGPLFDGFRRDHIDETSRYNAGLRGTKYSVLEGGVRVPFAIHHPGVVPAGKFVDTPGAHIDLLPTLLDYAGVALPENVHIDGQSLLPLISGDPVEWQQRRLYMSYPGEAREYTKNPSPYPGGMALDDRYKMVNGTELYDLRQDPGETTNLAEMYPDILKRLDREYRDFWRDVNSDRAPYPRVEAGHPQENPTLFSTHWSKIDGGLYFYSKTHDIIRESGVGVHSDSITCWSAEGRAIWKIRFVRDGTYRIAAKLRYNELSEAQWLKLETQGQQVQATANPQDSGEHTVVLGTLTAHAGDADLVLTASGGDRALEVIELVITLQDDN